ncbi:MAG TPA: CUB domain-containing protein, partial [Chitinophagales bacterium]|nr:CUB domain-containing protein [Chitinophagales bacterium]
MKKRLGVLCALLCGVFTLTAQVYVMGNLGTISTCSGVFYDSGNAGGAYGNGENYQVTFCSSSGLPIYLNFSAFRLESSFDSMYIYDGNSTAAPLIGGYSGTTSPGAVVSSNGSNCLTITFKSDASVTYIGWVADIGCGTPPPPPPPSPGTTCAISQAFCSGTAYNFPAATNTTAEIGPDYDCLSTQPNPVWYYLQIDNSGDLGISLANTANVDVDFVCWGPFANSNACSQLTAPNVVDCSYSIAATEHVDITGAVTGQYYVLCITNFSNQPTNFTLSTDGTSTASTNCLILCNITAMTAIPGVCNPANNTHDVSGTLTVQYPPASGTLTITAGGEAIVINPPFANSINYSIPGISSTGGSILVDAQFSTDTSCHFTSTYTSPAPCTCSVTATNNSPVCGGTPVTLTATVTGVIDTYQWAGPNGYTASTQNPVIANTTVVQSGIYSVTITSGTCTATDTTEVEVLDAPVFSATVTNATCNGASDGSIVLALTSSPPATYSWTGSASNNEMALNLAAGNYSVTVTGGPNNCSVTAAYTITEPAAITLSPATITDASCSSGGSITVTATGGTGAIVYAWSNGSTTSAITNLSAGPYNLTVTDQNNCSATGTYTVGAAPGAIVFGAPAIANVSCFGAADGSITVSATGGSGNISYLWGNANGQTTPAITGLGPNVYSVVASDATGCSASVSYLITEPTAIVFDAPVIVDATCSVGGSITVGATGGTGTIIFTWSNGQTASTASNLTAGSYQVTATDQNSCTATTTYTVNPDPNSIILGTPTIADVSCAGLSDGSVTVNATGGNGTFNYAWSTTPAQYTATASELQ